MSEHTKEPWAVDSGEALKVRDGKGGCVAIISQTGHGGKFGGRRPQEEPGANARRICAAVNFTAGYSTEALEGVTLEEVFGALRGCLEHMEWSTPQGKAAYEAARAALAESEK